MKTLWKSVRITVAFCIFFSVFYILVLWIFAQFAGPNKGSAEVLTLNGKAVGAANVGRCLRKTFIFGDDLPVPVTVMMQAARQVAIKALQTKNTLRKWKRV